MLNDGAFEVLGRHDEDPDEATLYIWVESPPELDAESVIPRMRLVPGIRTKAPSDPVLIAQDVIDLRKERLTWPVSHLPVETVPDLQIPDINARGYIVRRVGEKVIRGYGSDGGIWSREYGDFDGVTLGYKSGLVVAAKEPVLVPKRRVSERIIMPRVFPQVDHSTLDLPLEGH